MNHANHDDGLEKYYPKDIFISYSHDDKDYIHALADKLKEEGFDCWIDKCDIPTAADYNEKIFPGIDNCLLFVAFLSRTYLNKTYCQREFARAIDKGKCVMAVRLDDVTEEMAPEKVYMFAYSAGHDIIGFHQGIKTMDPDEACQLIAQSEPFQYLRHCYEAGEEPQPMELRFSGGISDKLEAHRKKQYRQNGNYLLGEIRPELFPALVPENGSLNDKNEEAFEESDADPGTYEPDAAGKIEKAEPSAHQETEEKYVSLVEYLNRNRTGGGDAWQHVYVLGDGGFGKTVSLLETCKYLSEQGETAIYIPLRQIDHKFSMDDYLLNQVCRGNELHYKMLNAVMTLKLETRPTVVLLLDGLNEMQADSLNGFIRDLTERFIPGHPGVQIILSSRYDSRGQFRPLQEQFHILLQFRPLDEACMTQYVESCGLPPISDQNLFGILNTPLMLTLYCNAQSCKAEYEKKLARPDILTFFEHPDSVGKILHNFFQTQVFRAVSDNFADHLVFLEYFLPLLGYKMVKQGDAFSLTEKDFKRCIRSIREPYSEHFVWYREDRLSPVLNGLVNFDSSAAERIRHIALAEFSFLRNESGEFVFSHQLFRDYFAALYLCHEMRALSEDDERLQDISAKDSVLQRKLYSADILALVADITGERDDAPRKEANDWHISAKKHAQAEPLLDLWRGQEGEDAQHAVSNLLHVMQIGRNGNLFGCDFSSLDLRACKLRGICFSEWIGEKTYTANFDGAWIDRNCFIAEGHSSVITAVCADGHGNIYTGDHSGRLLCWRPTEQRPFNALQVTELEIIRLAVDAGGNTLLILTKHKLFSLDIASGKTSEIASTRRYYLDVRFGADGTPEVTFDTAPLDWYPAADSGMYHVKNAANSGVALLSGCVRVNAAGDCCVYSDLFSKVNIMRRDPDTCAWQKGENPFLLQLYEKGKRVSDICWHASGTKLLLGYSRSLFVLSLSQETLVLEKQISFRDVVNAVCYTAEDRIVVCHGIYTTVYNHDYTLFADLPGNYVPVICTNPQKDEFTYLLSANNELKLMDCDMRVYRMRILKEKPSYLGFAHDRLTGAPFICLAYENKKTHDVSCERYDCLHDRYSPIGFDYEIENEKEDHSDKLYKHYSQRNRLISIHRYKPGRVEYMNYQGLCIQGCTFRGLKGTLAEPDNMQIIKQNGGVC